MAPLVRALLDVNGWTQADLAARLDVSQVTVSRWLCGTEPRGDRRDAIRELAEKCDITAAPSGRDATEKRACPSIWRASITAIAHGLQRVLKIRLGSHR
ncbi:MAG: helix-turn-helix domain-containing protein [Rhodopseudomonas sp.]|nr:helix-turn-helix domain-containing protein [Rhodopseudomonas sp.]